jgi:membrane fusion protein, multidrug efflux system
MKLPVQELLYPKNGSNMKNITAIQVIFIAAIIFVTGCRSHTTDSQTQAVKPDSISAFILQKKSFTKKIVLPGELLPMERAEIFAKISGYLEMIKVDIGDAVQKGQVLAILDAPEMIANYMQANADLQNAKSKYLESRDAYNRILSAAREEGTVAAGELERMKNQMMADSAGMEALKSKLSAYSQLKDYLIIRAPFRGVVTQRNFDPGTLVGTGSTKPILIIENNDLLRLRLPVPEMYTSVNPDTSPVNFTVDAYPGEVYDAKLSRKGGAINLINRTETWEFIFPNKDNRLKSGMFANAIIYFTRSAPSFIVPSTAIVTNQERHFIIRLKNGKTEWVDVNNGIMFEDKTEIFGNLSEQDTILSRGTDEIKQDRKFNPKFQSK